MTPAERFDALVNRDGPVPEYRPDLGPCWIWLAAPTTEGYGKISISGRIVKAHRLAYELFVGPIPDGLVIDHLCRVRLCVNPSHIEPVEPAENAHRAREIATHCVNGHEFTQENTRYDTVGYRVCVTCRRESFRRHYHRQKALAHT